MMSVSTKAQSTITPPVLLCRLCHCEFTNFKEHVKSLVHLDARETKTTIKPPTKNKGSYEDNSVNAKKVKTELSSEESTSNVTSEGVDTTCVKKESTSSVSKTDLSIDSQIYTPFSSDDEDESDADLNGTATSKKNDDVPGQNDAPASIKPENGNEELPSKELFLKTHWHCKLCDCVQHADDGSFGEHKCDKIHAESLAHRPLSSEENSKEKDHYQWLINCSACEFETNDKAQFISHLQTELHDRNVKNILENARTADKDGTVRNQDNKYKSESKVAETNTKSFAKAAPSTDRTTTNSVTRLAEANKSTSGKHHQEKGSGASGAGRDARYNTSKSTPKPLMSLSLPELPESWNKSKPGWKSNSAVPRNHTPTNKPGILGEYRPDFHSNNIGFNRDDRLSRSTDLRARDRQDSRLGSRSDLAVRSLTHSEVNHRDTLAATSARADAFTRLHGVDRYDSARSGRITLASPTEKLSLSFAQEAIERQRQLEIVTNYLTSQRTGILPSIVSLDLATNSSFRLKHNSERDAMFDNYPASRSGVSRTDFLRNDLSRTNSSTSDHYFRSMYTRR